MGSGFDNDRRRRHGGSSFLPSSLSGLTLWFRPESLSALNDGDAVSSWSDESGNNNNATQGTANLRPLYKTNQVNGNAAVKFDGSNDELRFTAITPNAMTAFVVAINNDAGGGSGNGCGWLASSASGNNYFIARDSDVANFDFGGNTASVSGDVTGVWYVHEGFHNLNSTLNVAINGTYGSSSSANGTGHFDTFGYPASNGFIIDGLVAEMIFYNVSLSAAQKLQVRQYLGTKYGITVS